MAQSPRLEQDQLNEPSGHPLPPPPPKRLSGMQRAWTAIVSTVTVLGVIATAYALLGERESSKDTVSVRSTSGDTEQVASVDEDYEVIGEQTSPFGENADNFSLWWQIPISAPIDTFPDSLEFSEESGSYTCGAEQYAWLEEHATQRPSNGWNKFTLSLYNNATNGGAASLEQLRFDGAEVPSEASVRFECPLGGMGNTPSQVMFITADGEPARWGPQVSEGDMPEGSPVTINLSPGEATPAVLLRAPEVDVQRHYSGRFLADIVDSGETVVLSNDIDFHREVVPGYFVGYGTAAFNDGQFRCGFPATGPRHEGDTNWEGQSIDAPCTLDEAVEVLREAAAAVEE